MKAQLQMGHSDAWTFVTVYEHPPAILPGLRWIKAYPSREDAAWDAEQLGLISPTTASELNKLPLGQEVPALSAYIRNPKETLRTFELFPLTQAH
jgi:hypothetical protein